MSSSDSSATLILLLITLGLPLLSSVVTASVSKRIAWMAPLLASLFLLSSAIISLVVFFTNWSLAPQVFIFNWFQLGTTWLSFSLAVEPITLVLLVVVSVISFLVHLFSIGYMVDDHGTERYFSFLGFFTFSMQVLVLSGNLLQLFFFWELVGICSYFLIGHWRDRIPAAEAATKAFVMNRIGDAGLLVALALLWAQGHTLDISALSNIDTVGLSAIGFCVFLGVVGKSAQFPLLTWLPDAMEGPTPVSALIHAATMVAAGVFLLARLHFIFTPDVSVLIAIVGAITALYGAWHALWQFDIKKILAYSTLSQLGLMVMAVGAGAWAGAFFHLFTHAFFKAGLFLCAGAIIHTLHLAKPTSFDPQDIRNMGGLRKFIPNTFIAFSLAAAGLAGLPFFTGFVSKEVILVSLFQQAVQTHQFISWIWLVVFIIISFMTVVYTFRLVKFVFFGEFQSKEITSLPRTPMIMVLPIALLAIGSLWFLVSLNPLGESWLTDKIGGATEGPVWIAVLSVLWVAAAFAFSYFFFAKGLPARASNTHYLDKAYSTFIVRPFHLVASFMGLVDVRWIDRLLHRITYAQVALAFLVSWFDRVWIDGVVNVSAKAMKTSGNLVRLSARGQIQGYLLWSALALVIFLFWLLK